MALHYWCGKLSFWTVMLTANVNWNYLTLQSVINSQLTTPKTAISIIYSCYLTLKHSIIRYTDVLDHQDPRVILRHVCGSVSVITDVGVAPCCKDLGPVLSYPTNLIIMMSFTLYIFQKVNLLFSVACCKLYIWDRRCLQMTHWYWWVILCQKLAEINILVKHFQLQTLNIFKT